MRIAMDVMGGDYAPAETIAGAVEWVQNADDTLILVGREDIIRAELQAYDYPQERIEIAAASEVVEMNESPATAMRRKKDASIFVASRLVKEGRADAVVSCGSTGAQLTAAIFILGRLESIDRPPVVTAMPNSLGSYTLLLDSGANVDCKAQQMLQFALLGKAYASILLGLENPRIGLLNNGEEEGKGNSLVVESYELIKQNQQLNFIGNTEGRDIFTGKADVLVCDGFTGNIVLKSIEGVTAFAGKACMQELGHLPEFFHKFDYSQVGGAPLLGVDGVSIVCHGSSKRKTVYNGIKLAVECLDKEMVKRQKLVLGQSV